MCGILTVKQSKIYCIFSSKGSIKKERNVEIYYVGIEETGNECLLNDQICCLDIKFEKRLYSVSAFSLKRKLLKLWNFHSVDGEAKRQHILKHTWPDLHQQCLSVFQQHMQHKTIFSGNIEQKMSNFFIIKLFFSTWSHSTSSSCLDVIQLWLQSVQYSFSYLLTCPSSPHYSLNIYRPLSLSQALPVLAVQIFRCTI